MKIGNFAFQGRWEDMFGTRMFFEGLFPCCMSVRRPPTDPVCFAQMTVLVEFAWPDLRSDA
jgi:hypothetical protein